LLGIVIPTRWEAGAVLGRFGFLPKGNSLYAAVISGRTVLLCISGVGREAARRAAGRLVDKGAKELVSMGFCGALIPELKVGDLVTDRIATVDRPVRNVEERRALTERAHAVAVDMETQAIVESGTRRGVPIRILRVVSDEFQEDLGPLFGKDDRFSPWKMALRLLNPSVWPLASRLRRHSAMAKASLAEALQAACV
jgi:nucleoside phosphorylase